MVGVVVISIAAGVIVVNRSDDAADSSAVDSASVPADEFAGAPSSEPAALPDVVAASGATFAGADPTRLPGRLDALWSRSVPMAEVDDIWVEVVDRQFVLVAIGSESTESTELLALDAQSGATRWSKDLAAALRSVRFVAATPDSIALIVDGALSGTDQTTGESVWELPSDSGIFGSDVDPLAGTDLLAVGSSDGQRTLVDMITGAAVAQLEGPTIATDHLGRWYVRRGSDLLEYDLADGFQQPTVVATQVDDRVVAVVDGQVLDSGPEGWTASVVSAEPVAGGPESVGGGDDFPTAAAILPMVGTTFLVAGAGSIIGANLDGREIRAGWERNGAVTAMYPTDRGYLVQAATEGGAIQTIMTDATASTSPRSRWRAECSTRSW